MEYRLNKNTYKICFLARLPFLLIVTGAIAAYQLFLVDLIFEKSNEVSYIVQNVILVILILILTIIFIYAVISPYFLYKNARLYINDEYIEYHRGKLFYSAYFVPIAKVQQVEINSGPI